VVKKKTALLLILVFAFTVSAWSEVFLNRIEASIQYEYLHPDSLYGAWNALDLTYYRQVNPGFNFHVGVSTHYRENAALLLYAGIGKSILPRLYTNLAISGATKCDYLQQYRLDADINLKLLKNESLIATLGYAYVNYHTKYKDVLWRYGLSYYITRFIFEFIIYDNTSTPGDVKSSTSLFSLAYGVDGWQWTHFIFNIGKQAYYVTYDVVQESNDITIKHRRWLKNDFGWFASLGYMQLGESYDKYLLEFGLFWQY
jgi:YaiO family outer membrane protein